MRLAEILVCAAIFALTSYALAGSLVNVRRCVSKAEASSNRISYCMEFDEALRREIGKFEVPYWRNFDTFNGLVTSRILEFCEERDVTVVSVTPVYDSESKREGVDVEWIYGGEAHSTRKYVKQRLTDGN